VNRQGARELRGETIKASSLSLLGVLGILAVQKCGVESAVNIQE
jgi:hypothetical protein